MTTKRHKHANSPQMITPAAPSFHNRILATDNHVYHPTKGWRKMRKSVAAGYYKIEDLLSRLVMPK